MAARSVECKLANNNAIVGLRRAPGGSLDHGVYATDPPAEGAVVAPFGEASWLAESDGFMTGTAGTLIFELVDGGSVLGKFTVSFSRPFVGDGACWQRLDLQDAEAFKAKYGNPYMDNQCEVSEIDGSSNHLRVAYIFSVTRPKAEDASAGGPGEAKPDGASQDPNAAHQVTVEPGKTACASAPAPSTPPRLCMALNEVKIDDPNTDTSVGGVLKAVANRLDKGIDEVWKKGECLLWDPNVWKADQDDEKWARALTELLIFQPYLTPEVAYSVVGHPSLNDVYKAFNDASDPKVGVTAECQHLVTYAVLSRGYGFDEPAPTPSVPSGGFSCGQSSCALFNKSHKGNWYEGPAGSPKAPAADPVSKKGPEGEKDPVDKSSADKPPSPPPVASVIALNNDKSGKTQESGSHTYFILRSDKGSGVFQLFDTGGGGPRTVIPTATQAAFGTVGIYDNEGATSLDKSGPYLGFGVLPTGGDGQKVALGERIARLKKTRRIGLARLVIAPKGSKFKADKSDVDYVSPLIRMWGDDPSKNFGYGHFLFSLRELGLDKQDVFWVFYAPRDKLSVALYNGSRADKLSSMKEYSMTNTMIVGVMSSRSDGKAVCRMRVHAEAHADELPYEGDNQLSKLITILEQDKVKREAKEHLLFHPYWDLSGLLASIPAAKSYPENVSAPPLFSP
jgi:hypothetical protein